MLWCAWGGGASGHWLPGQLDVSRLPTTNFDRTGFELILVNHNTFCRADRLASRLGSNRDVTETNREVQILILLAELIVSVQVTVRTEA